MEERIRVVRSTSVRQQGATGRRSRGRVRRRAVLRRTTPQSLLALAAATAATVCGGAPDGPIELKFGHVGEPGSLFALSAEEFAKRANARLAEIGVEAEVLVFGSSQLGGDQDLLAKLPFGTVDFALPSSIMSTRIDEFGLFEMPYVVEDREHMRRIEEEIFWSDLAPLAEEQGLKIVAVWENGFRHVTNRARPIVVPADLEGIKLRTPMGKWRLRLFQRFGANPSAMALSEVFMALRTGNMDGQENPLAQIYASNFHRVQPFLSLTEHVYTPAYLTVSSRRWDQLPGTVRAVLEEEAKAVQAFVHETAERMDRELLAEIREAGVAVNEVNRSAFLEGSRAIYDEFGAEVEAGRGLIERALPLAFR